MKNPNLVIVESPAKANIIKKYLNSIDELKKFGNFEVIASYGHIRDLEKKNGIDIKNNFKPNYKLIGIDNQKNTRSSVKNNTNTHSSKSHIELPPHLKKLKESINKSNTIWLAADCDREGEAIAWHIKEHFNLKNYKRIVFNEITKDALKKAVLNPTKIDMNLVDSQQTRRFLDRIVGFQITPLLWNKFNTNITLSAGRVQSATLKIIIDKELEVQKHKSESYYISSGQFKIDTYDIEEAKYEINDKIHKFKTNKEVVLFLKSLKSKYSLENINTSTRTEKPPYPFITSTLQQSGSGQLRMSIKQVMGVAQGLYEAGLITYMRTDSYNLSSSIIESIAKYVKTTYGDDYYFGPRGSKKSKNSQEAHEAIRPTKITLLPKDLKLNSKIKEEHKKLYELIWKRTIESQMQPAKYYDISICIKNETFNKNQCFIGKFKIYFFDGYLALYGKKINKNFDLEKYKNDIVKSKNKLKMISINAKNTWSTSPPRFSEASIVKVLETAGIGRPSTYSSILSKLYDKRYIEKKDILGDMKEYIDYKLIKNSIKEYKINRNITDEKSKLIPTDIGIQINKYMVKNFKTIVDSEFTSNIEKDLDKIALGEKTLLNTLKPFYKDFDKLIVAAKNKNNEKGSNNNKIKLETYSNEIKIKNINYIIRIAKYGPVIQYTDLENKEKSKYISLVPYLKQTNKNIENINKKDIELLVSLPKVIGTYKNIDVNLLYARYGFYLQYGKKYGSIFKQNINYILNGQFDELINLIKQKKIIFK